MDPSHPSLPQKPPGVARGSFKSTPAFAFTPRAVAARSSNNTNTAAYDSTGPPRYPANQHAQNPYAPENAYGGGYGHGYGNQYGQYGPDALGGAQNGQGYSGGAHTNFTGSRSGTNPTEHDSNPDEYAAWLSAYQGNPTGTPSTSTSSQLPTSAAVTGNHSAARAAAAQVAENQAADGPKAKPKTVAQQHQQDGWDPAQLRLFVGNLAGEVTDDTLAKAFSAYPSVTKTRVLRDKDSTKSKGYGFVQMSDHDEVLAALNEMQGKYIGSHPAVLKIAKSTIMDDSKAPKKTTQHAILHRRPAYKANKGKNKHRNKSGNGQTTDDHEQTANSSSGNYNRSAYGGKAELYGDAALHANTSAGVHKNKKHAKTKDGLQILG